MIIKTRGLSKGALASLFVLAGAGLLVEPISHPASTKWALHLTPDSVSRGLTSGDAQTSPPVANSNVSFLGPESRWDQVIHGLGEWFPSPRGPGFHDVGPFSRPEDLLAAVQEGYGECSKYAEALMVLCSGTGRSCREWGLIQAPGSLWWGHSMVDVWIPELDRWGMVDVFYGFWARGPDGHPLSARQFERAIRGDSTGVALVPLTGRVLRQNVIRAHYGSPRSRLAVMLDNDPERLARHWTRAVETVNKPAGQFLQWAMGIGPSYYLPASPENAAIRAPLVRLRTRTILGLLVSIVGVGLLVWPGTWRARRLGASG